MKYTGLNSYKSWGMAMVCTVVNFLSLLPVRISGLLFVSLIEHYDISRKMASQPIILSTIIRTAIGPLVGYLGGKYECRTIIIWGAIFSSVGFGACYFATGITFVTISIGLLYGVGLAFGNTLVPLVIKQHFDKHASKANGLALMGCCLNAIFIPPIFEYFLETYGISGAFLITSGIMLNGLPAAMLLKNPHYRRTQTLPDEEPKSRGLQNTVIMNDETARPNLGETEKAMTSLELEDIMPTSRSLDHCTVSFAAPEERINLIQEGLDCNNVRVFKSQNNKGHIKEIASVIRTDRNGEIKLKPLPPKTEQPMRWIQNDAGSMEVIDVFINTNDKIVAKFLPQETKQPIGCIESNEGSIEETDAFIRTNGKGVTGLKPHPQDIKQPMGWKRFSVFKQPSYIIILITQAVQALILFTVWTIIIDLSRDKGIPSHQELYFLMFLPVSELFGYVGLTWVTDGGYLSTPKFCVCCYMCLAFSCAGLVWSQAFWTMMFTILCFSFFSAAITTVTPVMTFEMVEEKHHAIGMASRFMLFGPLGLAMPSVIGFFRENIGSYDGLLYFLASLSLLSSFLFILLPYIVSCRSKKKSLS